MWVGRNIGHPYCCSSCMAMCFIQCSGNKTFQITLCLRVEKTASRSSLFSSGILEAFSTEPKETKMTPCSAPCSQEDMGLLEHDEFFTSTKSSRSLGRGWPGRQVIRPAMIVLGITGLDIRMIGFL